MFPRRCLLEEKKCRSFRVTLKLMADKNASDLFFSVGTPANLKGEEGITRPIGKNPLSASMVKDLAYSTMSEEQLQIFVKDLEMNLGFGIPGVGRFRANIFRQRGEVAMVIRYIKHIIPEIETLGIPSIAKELIMKRSGLILVVGRTGTGKSTTLASMIDYRNTERCGHILTIEDPIEFIYRHKRSVVDQREVGLDTLSYGNALKKCLARITRPDHDWRDPRSSDHAVCHVICGNGDIFAYRRCMPTMPNKPLSESSISFHAMPVIISCRILP